MKKARKLIAITVMLSVLLTAEGRGQSVDVFDPNANNNVAVVVLQPNGKILLGGTFTTLSPNGGATVTRNRIARLNKDGTLDTAFDPNSSDAVYAIAVQADGKILVGGFFVSIGGQVRSRIARLDATTGLADSFDPAASGTVLSLAVQADGNILAGGVFDIIGGQTRNGIARLDPFKGLADSFNPGADGAVFSLVTQPDGKILAGGSFTTVGGKPRSGIVRLDPVTGAVDSFSPNPSSQVNSIALQADGKVLIGGSFTTVGGQTRFKIARLESETGLVDSFDPNVTFGDVESVVVQADGRILAGGDFTMVGGQPRNRIARIDAVTGLPDSFDPHPDVRVDSIVVQADGKILFGGSFTILNPNGGAPVLRNNIARVTDTPIITSPLIATGTVGQPFLYQFEASGATVLGVTGLAPGLTFDPSLSAITGIPTTQGTFETGLSATNPDGKTNATLTITVQPAPASGPTISSSTAVTGRVGQPFTFQVYTTGGTSAARIGASGLPPGLSIDAVSGRISGTATTEGSSAVTLTVTDGPFITSSIIQLTFTSDPALPVIISPGSASLTVGQFFSYTISAPSSAGPDDPTIFALIGNLPSGLTFNATTGVISGIPTGLQREDAKDGPLKPELAGGTLGSVQLFASNSHGTSTFQLLFLAAPLGAVNISTRLLIGTNENVLIGGFIITGNAPKVVIIRALGPSTGVSGALQDPTLELHDGAGGVVANDNWRTSQEQIILATGIQPVSDLESAIVAGLDPGNYTAVVAGAKGTAGIGLVEVYDLGTASLDTSGAASLAQISTRGLVGTENNVMIGGFIISGQATRVIVRAIGPSLTPAGVANALADPTLELHDGSGSLIFSNDNWRSTQPQEIIATGVPPTDDLESAIVATLAPGNYTAIVAGKDNTIGVALVEVYTLQ